VRSNVKTKPAPGASGPNLGALLTVGELVAAIVAAGMDPDTTTIQVDHEPVRAQSEDWRLGNSFDVHFTGGCHYEEDGEGS
jgi:hypothetical protein